MPRTLFVVAGLIIAISIAFAAGPALSAEDLPTAPTNAGQEWSLVFSDEFDAPGAPDPERWTHDIGYIANNEAQYYTTRPENVRVEDGALVIEARKEKWEGYGYTSARLKTEGLAEFLHARVEFRAKLPVGRGTWPALWVLGADHRQNTWPRCGEIDIMENVGFDPHVIHAAVHTEAFNHSKGNHRTAAIEASPPPWEEFHVYSMEWSPESIEVFLDGERYFTFENDGTGTEAWPFDRPHFVIINLAIGGFWGGQEGIDDSLFPHRLYVDYVRVYQREQRPER